MNKKENYLRTICRNDPEWIPMEYEAVYTLHPPIVERPYRAGKDCFNVAWEFSGDTNCGTYPAHNGHTISDIKRWREQITIPDIKVLNWENIISETQRIDREQFLVSGFVEMGLFERSCLLMSMEEALINYIEYSEDMYDLVSAIADYKIELIKKFHDVAKLDMLWYGDDWGTQSDLMISKELWCAIIMPNTARIYDCLKERDIIINQHSCGKIERIFINICDMGADIWNPCQPCNNLTKLKQLYGDRISFAGGLDSQFILDNKSCSPEDVREEVRNRFWSMSTNGGYLIGPSHSVPYDENKLHAMYDEIKLCNTLFRKNKN